ncbi:hypothetical protein AVEN_222587-1 [Araneus ventricosus]|uniref:F-box domain-containing protein n=1 Tax=Araneus ventricosus TaxID=182803 RepID=A0A4Y2S2V2_ARAVE|nr:hypothetical protein AVEN_222587-1 [Araneus ventricosus]
MSDKRDSETSQSIASNETEECDKQGQWSELPSLPLENIYSFLTRQDQFNMSMVCRKWSEGYGSPSVWKTFTFDLSASQVSKDNCKVMTFVLKYSRMFRHVEIDCIQAMKRRLIKSWSRYFIEFLQILTSNSQLQSFKLLYLSSSLTYIGTPTYKNICRAIADFLGSQRHLKRVEFDYCSVEFNEGVEFLRKLTENSRESLTHLVLRRFVYRKLSDREQVSNLLQHIPKLSDLPSLKTLETDYSLIFENMVASQSNGIQTIKSCKTRVLSKIILHYCHINPEFRDLRGLTSTDWRFLKILCPDLQVDLRIITLSETRENVEFLIVPNMPITRLEYIISDFDEEEGPAVIFDHLLSCNTNDHLVTLHLEGRRHMQFLSSTFIPFFQACKKLKCLKLFINSSTSGIDLLLKSWQENPPESLEKVTIDVWNIDKNDYPILMNLTSEYVPLLELAGLNVRVKLHVRRIIS